MLQGAIVNDQPKSISAARPKKPGPHARAKERQRGGHNVMWRRITSAYDDNLKKLGANPAMVAPVTRWVLFGHLTRTQGMAARRYADIIRNFEKFFSEGGEPLGALRRPRARAQGLGGRHPPRIWFRARSASSRPTPARPRASTSG
jgi:hypothetical protein